MVRHPFTAPVVGSALFLAMIAVRHQMHQGLDWMALNLALAWAPLVVGHVAARHPVLLWVLGPVWLAFLPNAPYLLTDLVHLKPRSAVPLWFDAALLGWGGALGLGIGVVSLREVAEAVGDYLGRPFALGMYIVVPTLCGFGMYLGRVLRFNSWDLVLRPSAVFEDVIALLARPEQHLEAWALSATFAAVYLAAAAFAPPARRPSGVISRAMPSLS